MRIVYDTILAFVAIAAATLLIAMGGDAFGQTASCTSLSVGQTQDITAFSVCKKVTLNSVPEPSASVAGICVPTNTTAAEWQSFYDNPPAGVSVAECATGCAGYSYGGYCYYWAGDAVSASCDTVCAGYGGCNLAGTKYIGSDDSGSTRCSAVVTALVSTPVTASGTTGFASGCYVDSYKGGWVALNAYSPTTTCSDTTQAGRVCACNSGGGSAPCNLPWGGTTPHGTSVTAYAAPTSCGACTSETRTCTNGTLSGSYTNASCSTGVCDCTAPWGTVYANGTSGLSVSPTRYPSPTGCTPMSGEPRCVNTSARVTCSSGVLTCSDAYYGTQACAYYSFTSCTNEDCGGGGPPCCFVGDAVITMADGTKKPISQLIVGDKVMGQTGINTVLQIKLKRQHVPLYRINGSKPFVTGGHPFKTQGGWKAVEPSMTKVEGHDMSTAPLKVGDTLYLDDGSMIEIKSIEAQEQLEPYTTYSPTVDGDGTYYSNGYLVHNKNLC